MDEVAYGQRGKHVQYPGAVGAPDQAPVAIEGEIQQGQSKLGMRGKSPEVGVEVWPFRAQIEA